MDQETRILGIETSCDETAAAVVESGCRVVSNVVASQAELHARYGGVFPEVASRLHIETIFPVVAEALSQAHAGMDSIDAIAVTRGPGLAGSLVVGLNMAKGLALASGLPLLGVNHLEAHLYSTWLVDDLPPPEFPLLGLIVSGGHTELILMTDHLEYQRLGATLDDAAGEAFDKVARLLGLAYPGGPSIQAAAENGNATAFRFPRAWLEGTWDFSFSGLKTAVARWVEQRERQGEAVPVADVAAGFQEAVVDVLTRKAVLACREHGVADLVIGGGVAANSRLRVVAEERCAAAGVRLRVPRPGLCTDNGAMVAALGAELVRRGRPPSGLDHPADSSMPVTEVVAR